MFCSKRCSHGGVCILPPGHVENGILIHTTGYCNYTDEEALTDQEGDDYYRANAEMPPEEVEFIIGFTRPSE